MNEKELSIILKKLTRVLIKNNRKGNRKGKANVYYFIIKSIPALSEIII